MYAITFEADYVAERSRLKTFFRLLLVIPWLVFIALYGIAAALCVLVAWIVLVVTARYPAGLYRFNSGFLRAVTRVNAFLVLMTDAWPPFNGSDAEPYPVRVEVDPPQERYSRWKVALRLILALPAYVVVYLLGIALEAIAILSWVVIVVTGRQPRGLFGISAFCQGFNTRFYGYVLLLTDRYPPFSQYVEEPPAGIS